MECRNALSKLPYLAGIKDLNRDHMPWTRCAAAACLLVWCFGQRSSRRACPAAAATWHPAQPEPSCFPPYSYPEERDLINMRSIATTVSRPEDALDLESFLP